MRAEDVAARTDEEGKEMREEKAAPGVARWRVAARLISAPIAGICLIVNFDSKAQKEIEMEI